MFGASWRLFKLRGIPISIHASWLIILVLLTMSFAGLFHDMLRVYYPDEAPAIPPAMLWVMGLVTALAFFTCIVLHELGHAIAAQKQNIPIRGITLFLFGGVAELGDEPPTAKSEFIMAIAGPIVSLVLGGIFALVTWIGVVQGWAAQVVVMVGYLAAINLVVLIFNMIPAFPLDGGRVLRAILWRITGSLRRATYWAAVAGRGFAWVLIGLAMLQILNGNWFGGVWMGLIGLFLSNAAQMSYQQVILRQALAGESVERFMNREPLVVAPDIDLRTWVEDFVYRYHRKTFPVVADGEVLGWIDTQALSGVPRGEWDRHTVGEVMHRDLEQATITPQADALDALTKMQRSGYSRLLVMDRGKLAGVISLKDLLRFLSLRLELEGDEAIAEPGDLSAAGDRAIPTDRAVAEHEALSASERR